MHIEQCLSDESTMDADGLDISEDGKDALLATISGEFDDGQRNCDFNCEVVCGHEPSDKGRQ